MLISYTLIQFDGGRLAGYGEPPERAGRRPDAAHLRAARILAIPVFWFFFTNLMNAPEAAAGSGVRRLHRRRCRCMGKVLFGTFLIAVIGDS